MIGRQDEFHRANNVLFEIPITTVLNFTRLLVVSVVRDSSAALGLTSGWKYRRLRERSIITIAL